MEFLTAAAFSGHALPEAMAQMKQLKEASWAALNETGAFDLDRYDTLRSPTSCVKRQSGRTPVLQRGPRLLPSSPGHGLSTRKGNDVWASDHGPQIFDLKKLLDVKTGSPKVFSITPHLTAHFKGFGNLHNIVDLEEKNLIISVNTGTSANCRGGLFMLDVSTPSNPKWA